MHKRARFQPSNGRQQDRLRLSSSVKCVSLTWNSAPVFEAKNVTGAGTCGYGARALSVSLTWSSAPLFEVKSVIGGTCGYGVRALSRP